MHFVQRVLSYSWAGGEMKVEGGRGRQNKTRKKDDLRGGT